MAEAAKLGWVIAYVPDVEAAFAFYEEAFGLRRNFVAEDVSGTLVELASPTG
jgi:predicted enzyme related to lactoylglutathione lyase